MSTPFNGAAVFQPRKFRVSRVWATGTTSLQWGRGFSTAEMCRLSCRGQIRNLPSMGPRFFNRGNAPTSSVAGPRKSCLQWGRGFSTAEISASGAHINGNPSLQWGRGFSTAEITLSLHSLRRRRLPSMGPRFFNRGNPLANSLRELVEMAFNGAAVFQPRKSVTMAGGETSVLFLQWGRGFSTAEMIWPKRTSIPVWSLQWGRGFSTAEIFRGH